MSESCEHRYCALNRVVDGSKVVTETCGSVDIETYGKRCGKCKDTILFDKPIPFVEPSWVKEKINEMKVVERNLW